MYGIFRKVVAAACLSVIGASAAMADSRLVYADSTESVFQVTVPDFWTVRVGGPREISPDETEELRLVERVFGLEPERGHGVWIGLISPGKFRTLDDAKAYARGLSGQLAQTTKIVDVQDRLISGRPATVITGTGRRDGRPVSFNVALLDLQNGRVVVALTVLQKGYERSALTDVNAIIQSIRAQ